MRRWMSWSARLCSRGWSNSGNSRSSTRCSAGSSRCAPSMAPTMAATRSRSVAAGWPPASGRSGPAFAYRDGRAGRRSARSCSGSTGTANPRSRPRFRRSGWCWCLRSHVRPARGRWLAGWRRRSVASAAGAALSGLRDGCHESRVMRVSNASCGSLNSSVPAGARVPELCHRPGGPRAIPFPLSFEGLPCMSTVATAGGGKRYPGVFRSGRPRTCSLIRRTKRCTCRLGRSKRERARLSDSGIDSRSGRATTPGQPWPPTEN